MTKATLLVDLYSEIRKMSKIPTDKIVTNALVGSYQGIESFYDPNKMYNKEDKCLHMTDEGEIIVIVAMDNHVTGEFDPSKWHEWSAIDTTSRLYDDYDILAYKKPKLHMNKVWIEIKDSSIADATNNSIGDTSSTGETDSSKNMGTYEGKTKNSSNVVSSEEYKYESKPDETTDSSEDTSTDTTTDSEQPTDTAKDTTTPEQPTEPKSDSSGDTPKE